jgi:protoheme IX farnesyltransferase
MYATAASPLPLFISSVALSMSTQALNQYIEVEHDKLMKRTSQRPLVLGLNPNYALLHGAGLGLAGMAGLWSYNPMTAAVGAVIWGGYLFVYTRMKRQSEYNTFVGSVVGSLPVYLGWIASGRSYCMIEPFALFLYMMAWQHQHFYGIRWIYFDDYNNAGFKMERNKKMAATQIIGQTVLTLVFTNYALRYYHVPYCLVMNGVLTGGLYWWGIRPSFQFAEGLITPKELKMQSYKHFFLVFGIFLLCRVFGEKPDPEELKNRKYSKGEDTFVFDVCY